MIKACYLFFFTLIIVCPLNIFAQDYSVSKNYFEHLVTVNQQWEYHKGICPTGNISFDSENERIKLHLKLVAQNLIEDTPVNLSYTQLEHRKNLIDELNRYADDQVFPINKHHLTRRPYFVDDIGTHCAVGQLMAFSGNNDLVTSIVKNYNFDYLEDIETPGIREWAITNGFTMDELKWIQPSYPPTTSIDSIENGTNGPISSMFSSPSGMLFFAGEFDQVNNLPCLHIGYYQNNQLSCLGNGLNGVINDVFYSSTDNLVYAVGQIEDAGSTYPIATFDGSAWQYISIPNTLNAIGYSGHWGGSGYKAAFSITRDSIPGCQEIWLLSSSGTWLKKLKVNGFINDIEASVYGRVYAGHFDTVIDYYANDTISVNNIIVNANSNPNLWYTLNAEPSDTIKDVFYYSGTLYTCGTCSQPNSVCLSRYLNGSPQPLLTYEYFGQASTINSMLITPINNTLLLGGKFSISPMGGTYGDNLAELDLITNQLEALAILSGPVAELSYFNNETYLGGDFLTNNLDTINNIGRLHSPSAFGIKEIENNEITVYPIPFDDVIKVSGAKPNSSFRLLSLSGEEIRKGELSQKSIANLESIPKGCYLIEIVSDKKKVIKRISK